MICGKCKDWHDTVGEVMRCHWLPERNPIRFNEAGEAEPDSDSKNFRTTVVGAGLRDSLRLTPEELAEIRGRETSSTDVYLYVPFKDKEKAKSFGASWDANRKRWFVQAGIDLRPFKKWTERPNGN